ncbi:hypothetical protein [Enterovibrio coralii]|uniref:Transcriptional regulator n=1 Tax=Enterovibrio coralii TaxID=294935 RepID=A0A135I6M8_9GAMM|nr:hypothetical protein [Enterovibrio coralii]KXF81106.1 hypothetical protein ATN88_19305 [Enterovibrio coralii]
MTQSEEHVREIPEWLGCMQAWYCNQNINEMRGLESLVIEAPANLFAPCIDEDKSLGIGYWLDACVRLHHHLNSVDDRDGAYAFLQFAYSKMQEMGSNISHDIEVKKWCLKRMDALIVTLLEFCQRQQSSYWERESTSLIEAHVSYMTAQNHLNLSQELAAV